MPMLDLGVSCRADSVPGHSVCIPSMWFPEPFQWNLNSIQHTARIVLSIWEVFIVLHWFWPESDGIRAIPGIPEESILAQGHAKLIKQFWQYVEQNSNSAGMIPGITWMECTQNDQEQNPPYNWHQNQTSAFADTQFGHHQWSFSSSSTTSVRKSGSVRFFAPKMGNCRLQPV